MRPYEEPFDYNVYKRDPKKYIVRTKEELAVTNFSATSDSSEIYPVVGTIHSIVAGIAHRHLSSWDLNGKNKYDTRQNLLMYPIAKEVPDVNLTLPKDVIDNALLIYKVYDHTSGKYTLCSIRYNTQEDAFNESKKLSSKCELITIVPLSKIPGVLEVLNTQKPHE